MAPSIPDRWLNYSPIGQRVQGTRFIAFKVPLQQNINERVEEHLRLAPDSLLESVPNLGLIIDLTNTNRYYSPSTFTDKNVEHQKLMIPGKATPSRHLSTRFCDYVSDFLKTNENNDKLIGVHCTHGVNRTGYMICYFMINVLKMLPMEAIQTFAAARGHEIERNNYTASLRNMLKGESFAKSLEPEPMVNWRQLSQQRLDKEAMISRASNSEKPREISNNSSGRNAHNSGHNRTPYGRSYGNDGNDLSTNYSNNRYNSNESSYDRRYDRSYDRSYDRGYDRSYARSYDRSYDNNGQSCNYSDGYNGTDGSNFNSRYNNNNYVNYSGHYGNSYDSNSRNYSSNSYGRNYGNNNNYESEKFGVVSRRNIKSRNSGKRYSPYESNFRN